MLVASRNWHNLRQILQHILQEITTFAEGAIQNEDITLVVLHLQTERASCNSEASL
jgi:serine phosphatase RsbU (regulator of sigma subunit)